MRIRLSGKMQSSSKGKGSRQIHMGRTFPDLKILQFHIMTVRDQHLHAAWCT